VFPNLIYVLNIFDEELVLFFCPDLPRVIFGYLALVSNSRSGAFIVVFWNPGNLPSRGTQSTSPLELAGPIAALFATVFLLWSVSGAADKLPWYSSAYMRVISSHHQSEQRPKKSSRFHLTGILSTFRIFRAKCIAHISTRRFTAMHIGLSFGRAGAKSVLLY
jgi:hypothetical protein